MLQNVLAYRKINTPSEDDETMVELVDLEDVVQQGNHAQKISQAQNQGISNLVHQLDITCASNLLPSLQLRQI